MRHAVLQSVWQGYMCGLTLGHCLLDCVFMREPRAHICGVQYIARVLWSSALSVREQRLALHKVMPCSAFLSLPGARARNPLPDP